MDSISAYDVQNILKEMRLKRPYVLQNIFVAICPFCMCMIVICTLWLMVIHAVKLYIYLITGTFR